MSQRQVYIYVDSAWLDISSYVKYDSLSITTRAYSDTFHYAQNECSFNVIYDPIIYPKILSLTSNTPVRIVNLLDGRLTTEMDEYLLTEDGFYLCTEDNIARPIFYGHITPSRTRSYNGKLDNSILKLTAIDDIDYFNIECGDIVYKNHAVMDPLNPSNSIVHKLATLAGWGTALVDSAISIPTVIECFAPESATDKILDILDTLLYEYGYALNLSHEGILSPKKWLYSSGAIPSYEFTEDNICNSISVNNNVRQNDGFKLTYYNVKKASGILLYRDGDCPYADDGSFAGLSIPAGYKYPFEVNTIDPVTSQETIVYQEYTDDGISYATNYAVENKLDYNYSAFKSNFTAIIATENHTHVYRAESGITLPVVEFYGKKCRIVFQNATGSGLYIYYNNVYGDVFYKTTEKVYTINISDAPTNVSEYTASFIYDAVSAEAFSKGIASSLVNQKVTYSFSTDGIFHAVGDLVHIVTNDYTDVLGVILSIQYEESTGIYSYVVQATSLQNIPLTAITTKQVAMVDTTNTKNFVENVVTVATVSDVAPSYRGIGILSGLMTGTFTGASVNTDGVITVGGSIIPNKGDWMINYQTGTGITLSLYVWDGANWNTSSSTGYLDSCSTDLMNLKTGGKEISGYTTIINAVIKNLFAQTITMIGSGVIQSETYPLGTGYYLDATGRISSINGYKEARLDSGIVSAYSGSSGNIDNPSEKASLISLSDGNVYSKMFFNSSWKEILKTRAETTIYNEQEYENSSIKGKGFYTKRCLVGGAQWYDTSVNVYSGSHYKLCCSGYLITGTGNGTRVFYSYEFFIGSGYEGNRNIVVIGGYNDGGLSASTMASELVKIDGAGVPNIYLRAGSHADTALYRNMMYCDMIRIGPLDKIGVDFSAFPAITYEEY